MDAKADQHCAFTGPHGEVRFARVADGTYPAEVAWYEQNEDWQGSFMALFIAITSNPLLRLQNVELFKPVEGDLFEFKRVSLRSRIFTFRHRACWHLVHVFTGKTARWLPSGEVAKAVRLMGEAKAILERNEVQQKGKR